MLRTTYYFERFYLCTLERWEGRDKEREGNIDVKEKHPSVSTPPTGTLVCNPGIHWESDRGPFSL